MQQRQSDKQTYKICSGPVQKGAAASMSSNNRHNPTTAPSSSPAISRSAWITLLVISSVGRFRCMAKL